MLTHLRKMLVQVRVYSIQILSVRFHQLEKSTKVAMDEVFDRQIKVH